MAYAAVISLKKTIHHFLNSSRISVSPSSREILQSADAEVTSLLQSLKRLDDRDGSGGKRIDALDGRIREAVHKMEDVLEFHASDQDQYYGGGVIPIDLEQVREDLLSLYETVKKMEEEYLKELENEEEDEEEEDYGEEEEDDDEDDYYYEEELEVEEEGEEEDEEEEEEEEDYYEEDLEEEKEEEEDDDVWSSSNIDFGVEMVGLSDEFGVIRDNLLRQTRPDDFVVFPILGVVGTGRTVVAKRVFDDLRELFDCVAWVSIGPNYQYNEILMRILVQIDATAGWGLGDDDDVVEDRVYTTLKDRSYMIVLDDVQDQRWILDYMIRCFPEQNNGSLVMYTTSLRALHDLPNSFHRFQFNPYNEHNVRDFLCIPMGYLHESPPPEVEEARLKIAMNIQGLLHLMKAVCTFWKADMTPAYLNELAADKNNPIFVIDDELSEVCQIQEEMEQLYDSLVDASHKIYLYDLMESFDFTDNIETIKTLFFPKRFFPKLEISSFYGMAGIGKSTLVKKIFEDPSVIHNTDHRAWITLGPKYHSEEILVDILFHIYPYIHKKRMIEEAGLVEALCAELSLKKCLIVLDDVWNQKPLHYLRNLFVLIKGKVLITTRLKEVAKFEQSDHVYEVRLLNVEESWCLFCRKVFGNGLCPPKLEKVGKKISEICEGLPLLILTVADLLSKVERTPEYWNKVAEKKNSLFADAQKKLSNILLPSYNSLPQHLKSFFLYIGVFPESYQIPISKLNHLLNAERFLEQDSCPTVEDFVAECLLELENKSLVILCKMGSNFRAKTYRLHSVFWYLATTEASKSAFFQVLNGHSDYPIQDIKCQRRLCIHNNILLSIKDVCISITSVSSAHSLLCTGPPHRYQVPIYFGLRLLRVMDALTIRLYEFENELVKLIHLRYLALTCNGKLPASVSKLWSLQYLIVGQNLNIKSCGDTLYLPIEIWDLKELRHLQIMGGRLPNPECGATLPNLVALLDVSAQSCTKRVLKRIPNVKKLGIQIELDPGSDVNPFNCLNRIWRLRKLESLKCVVMNPELSTKVSTPPAPLSMFPAGLKKLSLSGLCYPWEYMSIIGKLYFLEVLKLRCFAFQGPQWDTTSRLLNRVKFLSIDDTDLEHWGLKFGSLTSLEHISFKHCYKLKKLPDNVPFGVRNIEIVDCNPLVVSWAKQMKESSTSGSRYYSTQSSWDTS